MLGIDPGLGTTGVALVERTGSAYRVLHAGVLSTAPGRSRPSRLQHLHDQMAALLVEYRPQAAAVEQLFFGSNTTTAMQVGEARGVILLALEETSTPIWEYTPLQVKKALTGFGKATKPQLAKMVRALTGVTQTMRDDAFDAVAIAVCHTQSHVLMPERRIS